MIVLIVSLCFIVVLAVALIAIIRFEFEDSDAKWFCITSIVIITLTCIMLFIIDSSYIGKPTAIDVYRGKTTLEITYKDSIPIDSVVVFK